MSIFFIKSAMPYYLVAPTGHSAELPPRPICVGSDPSADIPIMANIGLAPRHFVLVPVDRGHRVQALVPEALLKVNGVAVQSHDLHVGDVIQAGILSLRYQDDPSQSAGEQVRPPELNAPPQPQMEPPPLPPVVEEDASPVHRGYRSPESPRPLDADVEEDVTLEGKSLPGMRHLGKAMAVAERAKAYIQEQKADQNTAGAVMAGCAAAAGVAVVWALTSFLPALLFFAVASGLGYVVGWAVRSAGRGFDLKFGYLGAALALAAGLSGNLLRMTSFTEDAEPHSQSGKVEICGADEVTNDSFRASLTDLGIDPDSPEFTGEAPEEEVGGTARLVMMLIVLLTPRSLIAYGIAVGAAYKSSFRTLTADEAARMQFG